MVRTFQDLLNCNPEIDVTVFDRIPQHSVMSHLAVPPTLKEVMTALKKLRNCSAPEVDGTPPDIYKCGGPDLWEVLRHII